MPRIKHDKPVTSLTETNPRLSTKQAAEYLNLSEGSLAVSRSTKSIPIPYFKVGNRVVYMKDDLDIFLRNARVEL